LLQAETDALSAAVQLSAAARSSFRQVGERAVRDTRAVYQLTGQMHREREALRGPRAAALSRAGRLREEQNRREQSAAASAAGSRLLASVFEAVTHCTVVSQQPGRTELLVCDAARVVVTDAAVECTLVHGLGEWRANLVRATGALGTVARPAGGSLQAAVEPVRARLLRCNAGASELRGVARRFNVIYTDDAADVYYSSKTAMAILHVRRPLGFFVYVFIDSFLDSLRCHCRVPGARCDGGGHSEHHGAQELGRPVSPGGPGAHGLHRPRLLCDAVQSGCAGVPEPLNPKCIQVISATPRPDPAR
jgi:hypothetical protein